MPTQEITGDLDQLLAEARMDLPELGDRFEPRTVGQQQEKDRRFVASILAKK